MTLGGVITNCKNVSFISPLCVSDETKLFYCAAYNRDWKKNLKTKTRCIGVKLGSKKQKMFDEQIKG